MDEELDALVETAAEAIHIRWVRVKKSQGLEQIESKAGEPLMVPYEELSEDSKDMHRQTVRTALEAIDEAGYIVVKK